MKKKSTLIEGTQPADSNKNNTIITLKQIMRSNTTQCSPARRPLSLLLLLLLVLTSLTSAVLSARIEDLIEQPAAEAPPQPQPASPLSESNSSSGLIWQPLRATFRPLNHRQPPQPLPGPLAASQPRSPFFPFPFSVPDPLALASSTNNFNAFGAGGSFGPSSPFQPTLAPITSSSSLAATATGAPETAAPPQTQPPAPPTTTPAPAVRDNDDEDQPTRVPLNRFRPTKPPSVDPQSQASPVNLFAASGSSNSSNSATADKFTGPYRITNECFECICEASTNCNPNSRCQTSDVRHTRCGMLLISYDQWLETGLSRQLVTREALARDPAADERAFYECVTDRECAERLMAIYMQKNAKDCDKDGRVDCYDVAAIHQGGVDQCQSESLLDSQYWSDFNACFGFGR